MTNKEIEEYLQYWTKSMKEAKSKEYQILAGIAGVTVMLAEIAKRMPEIKR